MSPLRRPFLLVTTAILLAGCRSGVGTGDLLPAVFGFGEGGVSVYAPGTLPVVTANQGDRLLGQSGTDTGRCIYQNAAERRFRADCPPGYQP